MSSREVALVAWELGAGRGHLEHLRPIVAALLERGWTVVAAVRDLKRGQAILGSIDPALRQGRFAIGQAPIFVHRATPPPVPPSSLAEILAHSGFADAARLRPVVDLWRQLIDAVKPGVIVADFAPSAVIAAHARVPVVMTGNGWTMPPDAAPIPPLPIHPYDARAAADAEDRICAAVAEATSGRWRPDRFARLLRGDTTFVFTPPLLDPYRASRREPLSWSPNLVIPQSRRVPGGDAIAYLPRLDPTAKHALAALGIAETEARAYLGGACPAAPPNVTVSSDPIDLPAALPAAPFALHHGGLGFTTWCLAYRVPQVILASDLEKGLIAHAVAESGAGVALSSRSTPADIADGIDRARELNPPALSAASLAHASPEATVGAILEACAAAID